MLLNRPWFARNSSKTCQEHPTCQDTQARLPVTSSPLPTTNALFHLASGTLEDLAKRLKRPRVKDDLDLEELNPPPRKKRRIQLELFTSWLSRPYAIPTTHILGTRRSRVGIWSRQRLSGGKLLRKAALLNSLAHKQRSRTESSRTDRVTPRPSAARQVKAAATASGASNYEDFDEEFDDLEPDLEDDDDEESDTRAPVNSDFRFLSFSEPDGDIDDAPYSFDSFNSFYELPHIAEKNAIDLVLENERHKEISAIPDKSTSSYFSFWEPTIGSSKV